MSLTRIFRKASQLASVAAPIASIFNPAIGGALAAGGAVGMSLFGGRSRGAVGAVTVPSRAPPMIQSFLPALPGVGAVLGRVGVGAAAGAIGRVAIGRAGAIARSAATYCRRNATWCASIGGIAAVEALLNSGQLPIIKRRRGRGITAGELRSFRRVARFTSKYCAPVRRTMKAPAMRKGRC